MHRVNEDYQKIIAIVESEKTAIIMSLFIPDYIWIATGSNQNLKFELLKPIKKRNVVLFPDKGEYFNVCVPKARLLTQKFMVVFYTLGSIKDMLNANAIQSSEEFVEGLMAKIFRKRSIYT